MFDFLATIPFNAPHIKTQIAIFLLGSIAGMVLLAAIIAFRDLIDFLRDPLHRRKI